MSQTILRLPAVRARTGLSRSSIYLSVSLGTFPRPVKLGARAVGWLEEEVERWIQARIQQAREKEKSAVVVRG
jgi:prophage regulatory protein